MKLLSLSQFYAPELPYVMQHFWRYECKYNRYSLVTTTVAVKQLHITS